MANIYGLSLCDVIPSSIADDPQVRCIIDALDLELRSVSRDIREALIISRIGELPEAVLDLLAWQWHVDFYESDLALEAKRGLVRTSILVHMHKGTKWAMQELCDIAFGRTTVQAWYEYGSTPYHFRVTTEANLPSLEAWRRFFYALEVTKSVRDWLDAIRIQRETRLTIYYGHGTVRRGSGTVKAIPKPPSLGMGYRAGLGIVLHGTIKVSSEEVI